MGQHDNLLRHAGKRKFDFGRDHLDAIGAGLRNFFEFRSLGNPVAQQIVFAGIRFEHHAAFMGHFMMLPSGEALFVAFNQGATQDVDVYSNDGNGQWFDGVFMPW